MRILLFLILMSAPVLGNCRHAIVLALDISGSVNAKEYQQQLDGLAFALEDAEVQNVVLAQPDAPIRIAVLEWAEERNKTRVQDWLTLQSRTDMARLAARVRGNVKDRVTLKTAIGAAINQAANLLDDQAACWRRTNDVSGDGKNNNGPRPREVYARDPRFETVVVNGLVVTQTSDATTGFAAGDEARSASLRRYFEAEVTHGIGSFTEVARGFEDYANAMKRKLIRELKPAMLSGMPIGDGG